MDNSTTVIKPSGFGARHFQTLLLFFGLLAIFMTRSNMSVSIVAMTNSSSNPDFEWFDWDEPTKGLILSSFSWGFTITPIPGGLLTHRFGAKNLYLATALGSGILSILIPLTASFGWGFTIACRVCMGLFQGFYMSCMYTILNKWIHPSEYFLPCLIIAGSPLGTFLMMIISGEIITSSIGWPGIFYISGGYALLWAAVWFWYGCESPSRHKSISETERKYLELNAGVATKERLPIPWKRIWTSAPYFAVIAANCANNWGSVTLLNKIPTYMAQSLDFDAHKSAIYSSLPYLATAIITISLGPISDFLINNEYLSKTTARKMFNTIGQGVPMVCMIALGFDNSPLVAVILLVISVGMGSGASLGYVLNRMDLAPNFAGPIVGISGGIANIFSIVGPIFVGYVVSDPTDTSQWSIVFFTTGAIYLVGSLTFLIFSQATVQKWNEGTVETSKTKA